MILGFSKAYMVIYSIIVDEQAPPLKHHLQVRKLYSPHSLASQLCIMLISGVSQLQIGTVDSETASRCIQQLPLFLSDNAAASSGKPFACIVAMLKGYMADVSKLGKIESPLACRRLCLFNPGGSRLVICR